MDAHSSTRRAFLGRLAAATAAVVSVGAGVATAGYDSQPPYVTLTGYDNASDELEKYRPRFVLNHLDIRPDDLYCWKAESAEERTTMYCYWMWYDAGQSGGLPTSHDDHVPDREPVYIEVGPSGEVINAHYDRLHYFLGTWYRPNVYADTHVTLRVKKPWHPYVETTSIGTSEPGLRDMHETYQPWIDNSWKVHRESVTNPWRVLRRGHWWPDDERGNVWATWFGELTGLGIPGRET